MNYRDVLFFIGKCLTLGIHPERIDEVRQQIKNGIEWEKVVQVSSGELVLPALYLQLKKASLLSFLPTELVDYLEYLTGENRKRNLQILKQINDISELLNENGIAPIFLKGTAHLLISLYDDIAERMIGDIDFLVAEDEMEKAAKLLIEDGYKPLAKYNRAMIKTSKHFPRLSNKNYSAAIEVHRQVVMPPHHKKFGSEEIISKKQKILGKFEVYIPSVDHLIIHNTLNAQLNDKAFVKCSILMRQRYDLLLLSTLKKPHFVLKDFKFYRIKSNAWLATTELILNSPDDVNFDYNWQLVQYLKRFKFFIQKRGFHYQLYLAILYFAWRLFRYLTLPFKAIYQKDERNAIWSRLSNPKWYGNHLRSYRNHFKK